MGFSSLVSDVVLADGSNYTSGRNGYGVCKFTPHHMAGQLTGAQCARLFQNSGRNASANYCIGYDGEIVGCVDEDDRAWTSSSRTNDFQAITVEVSNDGGAPDWHISDASWNSLVNLAVDVCRRYNFRLVYDGTPNGSLTRHNMFTSTTCPGPYLQSRFDELEATVNAILDGEQPGPGPEPTPTPTEGYLVKVTCDCLNIRQGPGTNYKIVGTITDHGTYTIVGESDGNGASKWGQLKSGAGWISLDYVEKVSPSPEPQPTPSGRNIGDVVEINGVYTSSTSTEKLNPLVTVGTITKILDGKPNPYLLNDGDIGWVNDDCIIGDEPQPEPSGYVLGLYVVNTPSGLNVRQGPGTQYSVVRTYTNGTRFDTYEIDEDWARTPSGWVCLNYCSLVYSY